MEELNQSLAALNSSQVTAAVKFLLSNLERITGKEISDAEVHRTFSDLKTDPESEGLRQDIVAGTSDPVEVARWFRALLAFAASQPALQDQVREAVEDARDAHLKDLGLSSLLVLGAVAIALKYRPKTLEKKGADVKIQWEDTKTGKAEDLGILATLLKAVAGH
jgi:hypothetical protein